MTLKEERELKKAAKLEAEKQRIEAMREYEEMYDTFSYICGIDEAGRGPLAGPVVAGAVVLPKGKRILYVNDSKKLSEKKREELFHEQTASNRPLCVDGRHDDFLDRFCKSCGG